MLLVLAYVAMCLAFGSLTHAWALFKDERVIRVVVSLVTATREELEYEKQSESNKALIDNTRKARDTCTVAQRKPEGVKAGNKP